MARTVLIPVAQFHRGNTSTYVERALQQLGVQTKIIDGPTFALLLRSDPNAEFLCVDSGEPINFEAPEFKDLPLNRVGYWLIDFRHHKDGPRSPTDNQICEALHRRGGWIFQSQFEDWEYCKQRGWSRSSFLPLAADPEVWSDSPAETKRFDLAFAGNVWDRGRAMVLERVLKTPGFRFGFPGHGKLWMDQAAQMLRASRAGFNVNSWYGTDHAFDLNMRFFETLSCGIPLITNWVPSIDRFFPQGAPFLATFRSPDELPALLTARLSDGEFLGSGTAARSWILSTATYVHRMQEALKVLSQQSHLTENPRSPTGAAHSRC